jgi:hypothetical protein
MSLFFLNGGTGSEQIVVRESGVKKDGVIQTSGEFFADGSVLELLRAQTEPEEVKLLHWHEKVLGMAAHVDHAGGKYAPPAIDPNLKKALRLPTRVAPPESTANLFMAVHELLARHLGQPDSCITALVCAVFASWMSPALPMAPIVWIFAPVGSPRNLVLQLLSLLCRRPLRIVGLRRGDIARLPMRLQPTLLLDEPDLRPEMQMILQSSTHRGARIISSHGLLEFFGPKIVCSHELPRGTVLATEVLKATLIPIAGPLPPFDTKMQEDIAEKFQARFLGYFLRNASSAQSTNLDASAFTLPTQDLARTLGAAVIGDSELQKRFLPLLAVQDEEIRADRARAGDAVVVEAAISFVHQGTWTKVRTGSIAERVSAIYKGRGCDQCPSAESVGRALKRVGIPSGRIGSAGNGIELTVLTCELIHTLALSYGVRAMPGAVRSGCKYCHELGLTVAEPTT